MKRSDQIAVVWQEARSELKDRGGTWEPARPVLLNAPAIESNEIFSSWFWRVAIKTGLPIGRLKQLWSMRGPSHLMDIRMSVLNADTVVEKLRGVTRDEVESLFWNIYSPVSIRQGLWLTIDLLSKAPIYRYCPLCLAGDSEPYFRKAWRLAYTYVCTEHGVLLRNKCPRCEKVINLDRFGTYTMSHLTRSLTPKTCQECGADLSKVIPVAASDSVIDKLWQFQLKMAMETYDAALLIRKKAPSHYPRIKSSSQYWRLDFQGVLYKTTDHSRHRDQNLGIDCQLAFGESASTILKAMKRSGYLYESNFFGGSVDAKRLGKNKQLELVSYVQKLVQMNERQ